MILKTKILSGQASQAHQGHALFGRAEAAVLARVQLLPREGLACTSLKGIPRSATPEGRVLCDEHFRLGGGERYAGFDERIGDGSLVHHVSSKDESKRPSECTGCCMKRRTSPFECRNLGMILEAVHSDAVGEER